jgi:integrase
MGKHADRIMLTDKFISNMKPAPKGKRTFAYDSVVPHLCVRVTDKGAKSFMTRKRMAGAKNPVETVLGSYPALPLIDARERAREALGKVAKGIDPKKQEREQRAAEAAKANSTFEAVAEAFKKGPVKGNRRFCETERIIDLYLKPVFGKRQIGSIKRSEISALLGRIERREFKDKDGRTLGGPVMADRVLAQLRKLMNWYAAKSEDSNSDDFTSPIVIGMARTKPSERKRQRTLDDDEIRALWTALDKPSADKRAAPPELWGVYVKTLFLSAQRREEVAGLARSELLPRAWQIPPERHKTGKEGKPLIVPLPKAALALIRKVPQVDDCDLVFTTNGKTAFSGFSKCKARLDRDMIAELRNVATARKDSAMLARLDETAKLLEAATKGDKAAREKLKTAWWTLHDLRRTAKTLMQRAGVTPFVSERVLGHVIPGVEGVYDCWQYVEEKRDALEKLAAVIAQITGGNVVPMKRKRAAA